MLKRLKTELKLWVSGPRPSLETAVRGSHMYSLCLVVNETFSPTPLCSVFLFLNTEDDKNARDGYLHYIYIYIYSNEIHNVAALIVY